MRSSYVKDRTISYQNNDEWCEEECDSYNYAIEFLFSKGRNSIIDSANEDSVHTTTIIATTDPVNSK